MRTLLLLVSVWVVLALTTLYLVIRDQNSLVAALVAWTGGLVTYRLGEKLHETYRAHK